MQMRGLVRFALGLIALVASAQAASKPNIILITLDAARADRMGFLGAKGKITPNLDQLARESLVFEHAYAQSPSTVASHATILTGTYPQTAQVSEFGLPLSSSLPYLPDLLHARGYRTAAFVGSIALDPRNGMAPGFDRGFDVYDAGFHEVEPGEAHPQEARGGAEVAARAVAWVTSNSRRPFFLWVHLNDAANAHRSLYDAAVHSEDTAAGRLLTALRARKLYRDAIIVVAADHGESLGAHGEDAHGIFLYDETIHVPLLLKLPAGQMARKQVTAKARLVDVAPSILEAAGAGAPPEMQGQSLLRIAQSGAGAEQPAYSRSDFPEQAFGWSGLESWRAGKYLYIRAPRPELYDVAADPGATHNLAATSHTILDTIAGQLQAFDSHFIGGNAPAALTSSEMQKLASLGYVGLQKQSSGSTAATGTDPKDAIATANKLQAALAKLGAGMADQAMAEAEAVAAKQPGIYLGQYIVGVANLRRGQYAKAVHSLHRAIEIFPDASWAHYYMGESLIKTGDFKTAAVHLEIACNRLPKLAAAHQLLAQAYEHLGRSEEARRERTQAATPAKP